LQTSAPEGVDEFAAARRLKRLFKDQPVWTWGRLGQLPSNPSAIAIAMKLRNLLLSSQNDHQLIASFGAARLGRTLTGCLQIEGGKEEDREQARWWVSAEIPSLLHYNAVLVVSDGLQARIGSLTANQEWFKVWRTIDAEHEAPAGSLELETLVKGVFDQQRFLDLLHHFIVFEEDPDSGALHKIIAGYHQFHAVNAAVEETVRASGMTPDDALREDLGTFWSGRMYGGQPGDRRAGVVWHTQGSGKSLSMLFYARRIIRHPAMRNPTLVALTDRNDLDDQLFGQFQRCHDVLGQTPIQAATREQLRELLAVASGGVVFTTIQKFLPEAGETMPALSDRRNIIFVADEAHRSQYDLISSVRS
jgi:type I restriction enzyme, R subunit